MVEYGAVKHERPLRLWLLAMFRNVGPPEEVDLRSGLRMKGFRRVVAWS